MIIVKRLREIQNRFGYLPDDQLEQLARLVGVPLYRIEEVASFFDSFRQERDKPAVLEVRVCRDVTCHHHGARLLHDPENPGTGLDALCDDPKLQDALRAAGPRWAEAARREPGGERIGLPTPEPERCKLVVKGVSCLGRCDRAPVVWVERNPMPAGKHAWVYARQTGETADDFRERVEKALRNIAADRGPGGNPDDAYMALTNADVRYSVPAHPPEPRTRSLVEFHMPSPAPGWLIDPYGTDTPRDYRAVRKVAEWIAGRTAGGKPPIPPAPQGVGGDKLKEFVKAEHPFLGELAASNLLGMGGAGEPTYDKWSQLWQARGKGPDKYVVCNGDESEPGTFKDRELLLRMPHLVVEGIIVAGLLTGATEGYIYIRHEYFEQIHAISEEIKRAERLGACGPDVFGTGVGFRVEPFESPGGYICGEQSALIEAMEDKRAQPRQRPPELQTNGLWDQPTVVNNVETLAWVPFVTLRGGKAYAAAGWRPPDAPPGTPGFGGRRLFSVSGDVRRPGVYEVPVGIPLGEVLDDPKYCGGVTGPLFAVAPSGPSSGLVPALLPIAPVPAPDKYQEWLTGVLSKFRADGEKAVMRRIAQAHLMPGATTLDLRVIPMDLNFFRGLAAALRPKVPIALGAAVVVYAAGTDPLDQAVNFTRFFRNESCGKCVPCRLGSQKLYQIGLDLIRKRDAGQLGPGEPGDALKDVRVLNEALGQTSICGLGQVAPVPLATVLEYFPAAVRGDAHG